MAVAEVHNSLASTNCGQREPLEAPGAATLAERQPIIPFRCRPPKFAEVHEMDVHLRTNAPVSQQPKLVGRKYTPGRVTGAELRRRAASEWLEPPGDLACA